MKHLDLFSGIGGFALACEWLGIETIGFVENNKYCQKVLRKHWPDVPIVEDIRDVKEDTFKRPVTLITGGFPCQPFSVAGKRQSKGDDRYLWPETLAVIEAIKPTWILLENVIGIINLALDTVLSDLEGAGYSCETLIIPACAVNAPHRRDRVWIVAYNEQSTSRRGRFLGDTRDNRGTRATAKSEGLQSQDRAARPDNIEQSSQDVANTNSSNRNGRGSNVQMGRSRCQGNAQEGCHPSRNQWSIEPELGRVAHGIPNRVDRLKCLGNAIVPQVAYEIIKVMRRYED